METESHTEEFKPETFQTVDDIRFIDAETDKADIIVYIRAGEDLTESIKRELKSDYWWLNEKWQDKGLPREQFIFSSQGREVNIYNWHQCLSIVQQSQLLNALSRLEKNTRFGLDGIDYILITDKDVSNSFDSKSQVQRGYSIRSQRLFTLNPKGIEEGLYRGGELSHCSELEGIISHETGHEFQYKREGDDSIYGLWLDWIGQNPETNHTVTEYAKNNPSEDFCESLVASLYDQEKIKSLAPSKYQFMIDHVLVKMPGNDSVSMMKAERVKLPRLLDTLTYKTDEINVGVIEE